MTWHSLSRWRDILWAADATFSALKMWRFKLRANLSTRGMILRLGMSVASASQVNVITFQKRALKALFHHFSFLSALFIFSAIFAFFTHESSYLFDPQPQKVWFFYSDYLHTFLCCPYNCLGLFIFMHFCVPLAPSYPLSFSSRVGRIFLGFLPICFFKPSSLRLCFLLPSSASLSIHGTYKNNRQSTTPQD